MSIKPKWIEKIANGEKTVEVRKTVPKRGTPFNVYMYCTKDKPLYRVQTFDVYADGEPIEQSCFIKQNGKVVGEFVCDYVYEFESEFVDDDCYESVALVEYDEDDGDRNTIIMVDNENEHFENRYPFKETCLSWEELKKYIGIGIKTFYGLHISDLKIYDTPKELSEFWRPCPFKTEDQDNDCIQCDVAADSDTGIVCTNRVWKAPQSWCYVEEL